MYDLLVYMVVSIHTLVLWYFGKFCQRTTKQRPYYIRRPNEVQKLDIGLSLEAVFVHKMIAYTTSYATTSLV